MILMTDLRRIPRRPPGRRTNRPRANSTHSMVREADAVWVSTAALARALGSLRADVLVHENGIDERLWLAGMHP